MESKRIAIITSRFWPVSGPTELAIGRLAKSLKSAGHTVEVFTVLWQKSWPSNLYFGDVPVRRLPKPISAPWKSFRSSRHWSRHIVDFSPDGILAFGIGNEIWTATQIFADQVPLVVRISTEFLTSDTLGSNSSTRRSQIFELASAILVDSIQVSNEIEHLNPEWKKKVRIVPDVIDTSDFNERSLANQAAARNSLNDAHPVLATEADQPLIVCGCRLDDDGGVLDLVRAWPMVLHRFPKARLWILGDGPAGKNVWEEINELDLVYSIIMPGFFDDLSEVLLAADMYVHPLRHSGYDYPLAQALVSGVCCLGSLACQREEKIEHEHSGLITDFQKTELLSETLSNAMTNPDLRRRFGANARKIYAQKHDAGTALAGFLHPFCSGAETTTSEVR